MKRTWLIRTLLFLLEAILILYTVGGLITTPEPDSALIVFLVMILLCGYFIYRSFVPPRPAKAILARVEKTYAAYLTGVFENAPRERTALLAALYGFFVQAKPAAIRARVEKLMPKAGTPREASILDFFAARCATMDGKSEEAETLYLRAIAADATVSSAHANLGVIYQSRGEYGKAEECFKTALSLDEGNAVKHNNLANLYVLMGRSEDARREARIALSKNDRMLDAYVVLALSYAMDKNKSEANRYARKCVDLGMEEAQIDRLVSALLRGDRSVLSPGEKVSTTKKKEKKPKISTDE